MLALLCVVGMFSIPLGDNIKVSLQLLVVMLVVLTAESVWDCLIVTSAYLLLGLFLPIYAGFSAGISPTFGYVIAFVVTSPVLYFMNKISRLPSVLRMALACVTCLSLVYLIGTIFMMAYLNNWNVGPILLVSVVPYLPFDAIKIAIVILIVKLLPPFISHQNKQPDKGLNDPEIDGEKEEKK